MQLAMVDSTDWNGELVAHASSECTRLCKCEVMRIGGYEAAHKAGLPEHEPRCSLLRSRTVLPTARTALLRFLFLISLVLLWAC
jgi:hypothetical protein